MTVSNPIADTQHLGTFVKSADFVRSRARFASLRRDLRGVLCARTWRAYEDARRLVVAHDEDGREEEKGEERDQNERRADKVRLRLRGLFGDVVKLGCSARRHHRSTPGSPAAQHSRDQSNMDACVGKYGRTEFIIFEGVHEIGGGSAAAILSRLAFTVSICARGLGVKGRFCYVGEGACSRIAPRSWFRLGTGHEAPRQAAPTSEATSPAAARTFLYRFLIIYHGDIRSISRLLTIVLHKKPQHAGRPLSLWLFVLRKIQRCRGAGARL